MAAVEEVKQEIPTIKTEDAAISAADDTFEDDTDLQFASPSGQAWLLKVPRDLWTAWKTLHDEAPDGQQIEIGKMRVYNPKPGQENDVTKQKLEIVLNDGMREYREIPKRLDLSMKTNGYSNTVVFSEKDLPGHKQRFNRREQQQQSAKLGGVNKYDRYGRPLKPGSYRTSIPKQTALAPPIQHEAVAQATLEAGYDSFAKNYQRAIQPKASTVINNRLDRRLHPGTNFSNFASFVTTSKPSAKVGKRKVVKEKAVRMSEEALMDALSKCFKDYEYWRMSSLRATLRQPEAWIKSVLDKVGYLIRSGPFAMCWHLKPEYAYMGGTEAKKEEANIEENAEESGTDTGVTGDEDEGGDFEDVKME